MIRLQNYTPEIYYKQSRDFQLLGRLYDVILNYVKTNVDMIYDIPSSDAAGSKLIDLLALTLGFHARHNYSVKQLAALCSVLSQVLRCKGTKQAVLIASTAMLTAEGIDDPIEMFIDEDDAYNILLYVPQKLSDTTLLQDLLDYILPAGMTCDIIRATMMTQVSETKMRSIDTIKVYEQTKASAMDNNFTIARISKLGLDASVGTANDKNKAGFFTNGTIQALNNEKITQNDNNGGAQ